MKHFSICLHIPIKALKYSLFALDILKDIGDLLVRFWVAKIFFLSFLTKITDWGGTIVLFKYEYSVPLLSPYAAAYLGTAAEIVLPLLLILGLGGRFSIFCFFIYNIIAVISFHFLWTAQGAAGLNDHINWGLLLMLLMLHGAGRISLDHLIHMKFGHLIKRQGKKKT